MLGDATHRNTSQGALLLWIHIQMLLNLVVEQQEMFAAHDQKSEFYDDQSSIAMLPCWHFDACASIVKIYAKSGLDDCC